MKFSMKCLVKLLPIFLLLMVSCKSEFEKIRSSGNSKTILAKADDYYDKKDFDKAQTLYELVMNSLRGTADAERVFYRYAYTHYNSDKFTLASYYFKNFASTFPNSQFREEADYMSAYSNFKLSPSFRLDQGATNKAIDEFQTFVNTYPSSERVKEANKMIDELRGKLELKAYNEGEIYFNIREYQSAVQVFENLLKDFPETGNADQLHYMIIQSKYKLASNSVLEKQEERFKDTAMSAEEFVTKYEKGNKFKKEVQTILKETKKKIKEIEHDSRYQNQSAGTGS
jgi:outer membrane protein assembly factor BamD